MREYGLDGSRNKAEIRFENSRRSLFSTYDVVCFACKVKMTLLTIPRVICTGVHVCLECILICKHPVTCRAIGRAFFGSAAHGRAGSLATVHGRASSGIGGEPIRVLGVHCLRSGMTNGNAVASARIGTSIGPHSGRSTHGSGVFRLTRPRASGGETASFGPGRSKSPVPRVLSWSTEMLSDTG